MTRKHPPPDPGTDGGNQVPARPHNSGSAANETLDGLDSSTEALRHAAEDTRPAQPPRMSRKPRFRPGRRRTENLSQTGSMEPAVIQAVISLRILLLRRRSWPTGKTRWSTGRKPMTRNT